MVVRLSSYLIDQFRETFVGLLHKLCIQIILLKLIKISKIAKCFNFTITFGSCRKITWIETHTINIVIEFYVINKLGIEKY